MEEIVEIYSKAIIKMINNVMIKRSLFFGIYISKITNRKDKKKRKRKKKNEFVSLAKHARRHRHTQKKNTIYNKSVK